jgi:serine O-acetyltransferase
MPRSERQKLEALARENAALRPSFRHAVREDARRYLGESGGGVPPGWARVLQLAWSSDDFPGVLLYRVRVALLARGVPIVPAIINRICIGFFNINIDDHIVIREGLHLTQGNVVLGGLTVIGRNATIGPYASIGIRAGSFVGPTLGDDVVVGTHCSILGTMHIGDGATIAPGSVVSGDVAAGLTVSGVPARPIAEPVALMQGAKQA